MYEEYKEAWAELISAGADFEIEKNRCARGANKYLQECFAHTKAHVGANKAVRRSRLPGISRRTSLV